MGNLSDAKVIDFSRAEIRCVCFVDACRCSKFVSVVFLYVSICAPLEPDVMEGRGTVFDRKLVIRQTLCNDGAQTLGRL